MLTGYSGALKRHLSDNIWLYSIIVFFFILGVCLGAITVNNINFDTKSELKEYVEGFLNITYNEGIYSPDVLKQSVLLNFYTALIVMVLGLTYLGALFIPFVSCFRGFCIGFTVAFFTQSLGNGGYLLSLVSILPQNIVYIPAIIILCVCALSLSMTVLRNKYQRKHNSLSSYAAPYIITMVTMFLILLAGSIIESYLTPFLIKIIVPYVVI